MWMGWPPWAPCEGPEAIVSVRRQMRGSASAVDDRAYFGGWWCVRLRVVVLVIEVMVSQHNRHTDHDYYKPGRAKKGRAEWSTMT